MDFYQDQKEKNENNCGMPMSSQTGHGLSKLAELTKTGILVDVTLVAKSMVTAENQETEQRFLAHKFILAMQSEYFKMTFEKNQTLSELDVPMDADELNSFIRHIYEEETICPTEENVERIYFDAEFLGMPGVSAIALDFMCKNISAQTWAKRMKFYCDDGNQELAERIRAYVRSDFIACFQSPHFENLNVFELIALLRLRLEPRISCPEHEIMVHILNWIKRRPNVRASFTGVLLSEVKLVEITDELLDHYFLTEPLLNQIGPNVVYKNTLLEKQGFHYRI